MSGYASKKFWTDAAERAIKTIAQSAIATGFAGSTNILSVDWDGVVGIAVGAGVLSVLTSIASAKIGDDTPAIVKEDVSSSPSDQ